MALVGMEALGVVALGAVREVRVTLLQLLQPKEIMLAHLQMRVAAAAAALVLLVAMVL
jgi:hypothetical protein